MPRSKWMPLWAALAWLSWGRLIPPNDSRDR
jgi:hypothetical protein